MIGQNRGSFCSSQCGTMNQQEGRNGCFSYYSNSKCCRTTTQNDAVPKNRTKETHSCLPASEVNQFQDDRQSIRSSCHACPRIDSWIGEEAWAYLNMYYVINRAASLLAAFQKAQTALLRELKRNHSVPEGLVSLSVIPSSSYL